jgi:type IV pilus assembly protein PilP
MADLRQWVDEVKARPGSRIDPLPAIKPYETYAYQAYELRDPFQPPAQPEAAEIMPTENGIHPDSNRPREPLEAFPLDSLRMVGSLDKGDGIWAIVKGSDGTVYRVRPGSYLGQNHGKIIGINEQEIALIEIVPDGKGGWLERPASIALNQNQ